MVRSRTSLRWTVHRPSWSPACRSEGLSDRCFRSAWKSLGNGLWPGYKLKENRENNNQSQTWYLKRDVLRNSHKSLNLGFSSFTPHWLPTEGGLYGHRDRDLISRGQPKVSLRSSDMSENTNKLLAVLQQNRFQGKWRSATGRNSKPPLSSLIGMCCDFLSRIAVKPVKIICICSTFVSAVLFMFLFPTGQCLNMKF